MIKKSHIIFKYKVKFLSKFECKIHPVKEQWRVLTKDLKVKYKGKTYTIPKGFEWDGASIPKLFQGLLPKHGMKYDRGACIHDWFCNIADALLRTKEFKESRKFADVLFNEVMKLDQVKFYRRIPIYTSVRSYGKMVNVFPKINDYYFPKDK